MRRRLGAVLVLHRSVGLHTVGSYEARVRRRPESIVQRPAVTGTASGLCRGPEPVLRAPDHPVRYALFCALDKGIHHLHCFVGFHAAHACGEGGF